MRTSLLLTVLVAVLAMGAMSVATADSITVGATKDNTVYSESSNSNGAGANLFAGNAGNNLRRGLLAFDVTAIPAGSTITDVSLVLDETRGLSQNGNQSFSLHKLTSDWGQGTSDAGNPGGMGAPATANDATWSEDFFGTSNWSTAGGDFEAIASATETFSTSTATFASTAALVADVQDWVDNGSNYGWALLGNESGSNTAWRFASSEASTGAPMLTVTFTPIPEPGAVCLVGLALVVGAAAMRHSKA